MALVYASVNSRQFAKEAKMNSEQERRRELAQRFYRDEDKTEIAYKAAREWYLGFLGEPPGLEAAYALGKKLLTWEPPHVCSGERVDNGHHEYFECDGNDSPRCPQYRAAAEDERCARCDVRKFDWVRVGGWYCDNCWNERRLT